MCIVAFIAQNRMSESFKLKKNSKNRAIAVMCDVITVTSYIDPYRFSGAEYVTWHMFLMILCGFK